MTNITEVENRIITLRGQQVIFDADVAELYGVRASIAGHHPEESEGDGYHHRHRGGVHQTQGTDAGNERDSAARGRQDPTGVAAETGRPIGGRPAQRRDAGAKQRNHSGTQPGDAETQTRCQAREAGKRIATASSHPTLNAHFKAFAMPLFARTPTACARSCAGIFFYQALQP